MYAGLTSNDLLAALDELKEELTPEQTLVKILLMQGTTIEQLSEFKQDQLDAAINQLR